MPSRDNTPRGGLAVSPDADRLAGSQPGSPAAAEGAPAPTAPSRTHQQASRTPGVSRRALKNWRVRSRLLLLITIPTLTAVILGGTRIVTSVQSALTFQRIEQLSNLSSAVTTLAGKLEDERDQSVIYIASGATGRGAALAGRKAAAKPQLQLVQDQYNFTRPWIKQVRIQLAAIGTDYPQQVQQDAAAIQSVLSSLPSLRQSAIATSLPVLPVVSQYTTDIDKMLAIDDDIALDSGDADLASNVRALSIISRVEEEASQQRALLSFAFTQGSFAPGVLPAVTTAQAQTTDNIAQFQAAATAQQSSLYTTTVSGSLVDFANQYEQTAIVTKGGNLTDTGITTEEWSGAMTGKIDAIRKVEQKLVGASVSRASELRRNAIVDSIIIGAAVILVLGLALVLTTLVGRSMVRPLRRLRAGALEIAGLQLPETVRRMSESDGSAVPLTVAPIDVDSTDEIGEVARAFDQVHREALRLAANEAALRGNVNAMFVNLSRRSQSLVERQIRLIDDLEQGEQDAERLGSLFQMDHLATRMRRNSENLLVLAGHDSSRRWNQPVALVDVLRAAVSEIEQYERVSLNVQPGISVRGHAVNDAVHLLAELAENATSFSSAETPVTISGHLLSSGGVLLDITDQGVGMGAEEMAHANWRLDNPPVVDVAVSRRMGLFVVARLAARHGVRVRLRPAASGGLTALVWLPDEVVSRDGASPSGSRMPDAPAEAINVNMPGQGMNGSFGTDERAATAYEVNAARTPKFAPLEPGDGDSKSSLGPPRVPGSGPHPGQDPWAPPASGPDFADRQADGTQEPFATAPQQAIAADSFAADSFGADSFGTDSWGTDSFGPDSRDAGDTTGTLPAVDTGAFGWPEPAAASPAGADSGTDSGDEPGASASGLPKRRVDRADSATSGPGRTGNGSTDLFALPGRGGGSLFDPGPQSAPPAQPAEPAQPAAASPSADAQPAEPAGAGVGDTAQFRIPGASREPSAAGAPNGANGIGTGSKGTTDGSNGFSWEAGSSADEVVVPAADHPAEYRLPIFEAVESDWFRRGRNSVGWAPQEAAAEPQSSTWTSPADEGWQAAAAAVAAPSSSGTTNAGLPKRVPKANLVPGTAGAGADATPSPAPNRSASVTRDRFSSFQRGTREGRAAASSGDSQAGEDDGSR